MANLQLPLDFNALRIAVIDEVQKITRTTCIVAEPETQNVPRPCKPYFTMKMISPATKSGDDAATNIHDLSGHATTNWNRGGQRKMTVSFNCYGRSHEEAYNYMALWQSSLELESVQADLRKAGIAVWLNGNVADLSALLNTGFEGRAQMDVQFGVASNLTENLGEIDTITIEGTVTTDQGNNVIASVEITAP